MSVFLAAAGGSFFGVLVSFLLFETLSGGDEEDAAGPR